jgi:D-beta-D-heptose 7-phosphate kinase/D-beta-D-heptose 1-phosphate adenosyltransferase
VNALSVVDGWHGQRVVVVGDAALDVWLEGGTGRLSREAPVPVVSVERRAERPGGAANVALHLAALGADVMLVSVVGNDPEGAALVDALRRERIVAVGLIQVDGRSTRTLHRVVSRGRLVARFDTGSTGPLTTADEEVLLSHVARVLPSASALVISDNDHGLFTDRVVASLATLPGAGRPLVVVDSKHPRCYRALRPTAVDPDWAETLALMAAVPSRGSSGGSGRDGNSGSDGHREVLAVTGGTARSTG